MSDHRPGQELVKWDWIVVRDKVVVSRVKTMWLTGRGFSKTGWGRKMDCQGVCLGKE